MPSRNKNFIILPKSWSGHGRTGSASPVIWQVDNVLIQARLHYLFNQSYTISCLELKLCPDAALFGNSDL